MSPRNDVLAIVIACVAAIALIVIFAVLQAAR